MMLGFLIFFLLIVFLFTSLSLAPWVPTKSGDLARVNSISALTSGERFLEIGCGDGKVSHYIARKNPENIVTGVELNPVMYMIAKVRNISSPQKNLRILLRNLYSLDFNNFDVIYLFGFPETNKKRLKEKIVNECKKGTRIISYTFEIEGLQGVRHKPEKQLSIWEYRV